ncbi:unnamed protein product [Phytophthora lilii]|uniref:Unnamed protein product n=1 Tax=Phytophthora lilii TaxID=2077276 RepID=A0A9W6YKM6_9STRA|nr:unnamed protein product [Phytophthora lilii]
MPNLDDTNRRAIVNAILLRAIDGQRFKAAVAAGDAAGDVSSRIKGGNSGRRGYDRVDLAAKVQAVPIEERRTIATTARATGVSTSVLQRLLRDKVVNCVTSRIKPALTSENMTNRLLHILAFIDERTYRFEPMHDVVHVDEKWFYEDVDKRCYYTVGDEEPPHRHRRSKRIIQKTMFLAAVARPR